MIKQKNMCRIKNNIKWKQEDWNSLGSECERREKKLPKCASKDPARKYKRISNNEKGQVLQAMNTQQKTGTRIRLRSAEVKFGDSIISHLSLTYHPIIFISFMLGLLSILNAQQRRGNNDKTILRVNMIWDKAVMS